MSLDFNRRHTSGLAEILRHLLIVHWLVHANVEGLLARFGMVKRDDHAFNEVTEVDKVAFHRLPVGIETVRLYQDYLSNYTINVEGGPR